MRHRPYRALFILTALLFTSTAFAHPGHATTNLMEGLLHPLTGLDHLLAIVAVGWWSAATQARRWWVVPLAFASSMLAGALLGIGRGPLPYQEVLIAASVVVLGLLMLARARPQLGVAVVIAIALALAHGYAHGSELPSGHATPWLAGMVSMTLALHLAGALAGQWATRRARWATPAAGGLGFLAGIVLLVGAIGA